MSNHTKEPWEVVPTIYSEHLEIRDIDRRLISVVASQYPQGAKTEDANAQRIVQCVNACADMKDPAKEIAQLRADRAELLGFLKTIKDSISLRITLTPETAGLTERCDNLIKRMEARKWVKR
jgi:hypothetical protein